MWTNKNGEAEYYTIINIKSYIYNDMTIMHL